MMFRWLILLLGGWMAATVSGAAGFGGALLLLPVLVFAVGGKSAVPILTVAQLLGNLSRAGFGWRDIRWRPAIIFSAAAVPASLFGSRLFVELPSGLLLRLIGGFLLVVVALRHTTFGERSVSEWLLAPAGAAAGFVSAVAGSAGPLGAAVFLSLKLPPQAYVATEAVTACMIHQTKIITYSRYTIMSWADFQSGLALGTAMILGSWTGRKLIERLPERRFAFLVETLLVVSALVLIIRSP
jgi:uncharacterized membrane protein YfcA